MRRRQVEKRIDRIRPLSKGTELREIIGTVMRRNFPGRNLWAGRDLGFGEGCDVLRAGLDTLNRSRFRRNPFRSFDGLFFSLGKTHFRIGAQPNVRFFPGAERLYERCPNARSMSALGLLATIHNRLPADQRRLADLWVPIHQRWGIGYLAFPRKNSLRLRGLASSMPLQVE